MKNMNIFLISLFVFQFLLVLMFSILGYVWMKSNAKDHYYLELGGDPSPVQILINILIYYVAYSHLIPISLYIGMEMLKIGMGWYIKYDRGMFNNELGAATCRNSDLIEELGQVNYVFSDKTGTLTKNQMTYRQSIVGEKVLGHFNDDYYIEHSRSFSNTPELHEKIMNFYRGLALCHEASVDYVMDELGNETKEIDKYTSSSPDEVALLDAAAVVGLKFLSKTKDTRTIEDNGVVKEYDLLHVIEFTSQRKMSSVILKEISTGEIKMITKGADTFVMKKLNPEEKEQFWDESSNKLTSYQVNEDLKTFAVNALRTLMVAEKVLEQEEFDTFIEAYNENKNKENDDGMELKLFQEKKSNDEADIISTIECDLNYVGCTAIEDELQDNVADTIDTLIKSNINVWVLTGDKKETAIEIGRACKLLGKIDEKNDIHYFEFEGENTPQETAKLEEIDLKIKTTTDDEKKAELIKQKTNILKLQVYKVQEESTYDANIKYSEIRKTGNYCLIVNGENLSPIIADPEAKTSLWQEGSSGKSVICCRVSPKQKGEVVKLAKDEIRKEGFFKNLITLAIGDGANDVPMIMEANVGVGIRGKEGSQAERSADFALSEFQHLANLLLNHGRNGYRNVAYFVCYYFYKNMILVFTELIFAGLHGFSG